MWAVLVITALLGLVGAQSGGESLLVNIRQGPVRGYKQPDSNVFAFYGIPYATAPTGRQKYMPPLPPPVWTEPLEAVNMFLRCMQHDWAGQQAFPGMQEDCLVANVYVPDTNQTNLPVMVTIHGGAFHSMFGSLLAPISFLNNNSNMIAVNFNYRLGVQGFLCLGTEEVPGNAGMKDQVALLRWVQENIASFGGNPNDVTIEGCSAGSISAGLLTISPMTQGLFHKVIAVGGGIAGSLTNQLDPIANAKSYAKLLNFDNVDDLDALEEFYKTASWDTLVSSIEEFTNRTDAYLPFSPCVEADLGTEIFLDDAPVNIMKRPNLSSYPIMYGYANMEGLFNIDFFDSWKYMMNEKFSDFLPADVEFSSDEEREEVAASYSFVDENTPYVRNTKERGADHCAHSYLIFNELFQPAYNYTEEYYAMRDAMREFYTNFVTTGVPVGEGSSLPAWPPADGQHSPHMSMGPTVTLRGPLEPARFALWDGIYGKHYRTPAPPNRNSAFRHIHSAHVISVVAALIVAFGFC